MTSGSAEGGGGENAGVMTVAITLRLRVFGKRADALAGICRDGADQPTLTAPACASRIPRGDTSMTNAPRLSIRGIVTKHLTKCGFGGLYCSGEPCGCAAGDLFPCGNDIEMISDECRPGYRLDCDTCPRRTEQNCPLEDGGSAGGWCIGPQTHPPEPREEYGDE